MPPCKPLSSLTKICNEWVLEWIYKSISVYGTTHRERIQIRLYLTSFLYAKLRQQLLILIFRQPFFQRNLTCKAMMLELLGDQSTMIVDFSSAGLPYIDEVGYLYRILELNQITSLSRLGVTCNLRTPADRKYLPDVNSSLHPIFQQMKNLRWVTLVGVADRTLLEALGINCPHIKYLNVAESLRVDDTAIANLLFTNPEEMTPRTIKDVNPQDISRNACASSLKMFCITGTNVSSLGVVTILHIVPNIKSFEGDVDVGSFSKSIEILQILNGHRCFNLDKLWDTRLTHCHAELISKVCPLLTFLSTDASSLNTIHVIQSITLLALKLYFKNVASDLYNYLSNCGRNLRKLVLVDHINTCLDLKLLVEVTPNLEHFEATIEKEGEDDMLEWPCLTSALVTLESPKAALALMTHAPQLKDLHINFESWSSNERTEYIDDTIIKKAVVGGNLQQLQRLTITKCSISMIGVNSILLHCPNVVYLATLASWSGLSHNDISNLRNQAKENNWACHFTMCTDWENTYK